MFPPPSTHTPFSPSRCGPTSLVLAAGQRLWQLPSVLERATHVLLWPWDDVGAASERPRALASAIGASHGGGGQGPLLVEAPFLLATLNEVLALTAVMAQPINAAPRVFAPPGRQGGGSGAWAEGATGAAGGSGGGSCPAAGVAGTSGGGAASAGAVVAREVMEAAAGSGSVAYTGGGAWDAVVVDVPLPLPPSLLNTLNLQASGSSPLPASSRTRPSSSQAPSLADGGERHTPEEGQADFLGLSQPPPPPPASVSGGGSRSNGGGSSSSSGLCVVQGLNRRTNTMVGVAVPTPLIHAMQHLGLAGTMGYLRLAHLPGSCPTPSAAAAAASWGAGGDAGLAAAAALADLPSPGAAAVVSGGSGDGQRRSGGKGEAGVGSASAHTAHAAAGSSSMHAADTPKAVSGGWIPLTVAMGVPLYSLPLCKVVCARAREAGTLTASGRQQQCQQQQRLCQELDRLVSKFSAPITAASSPSHGSTSVSDVFAPVQLPGANLLFDGASLCRVDLASCLQGAPAFL